MDMPTVEPLFKIDKPHFHTSGGGLAVGYKLYTYYAGTNTPSAMFSDPDGTIPYQNPIVLDSRGEPNGQGIYANVANTYKVILKDPIGGVVWSMDDVKCGGVGDITVYNGENFFAEYDETSYDDVISAINAGKNVIAKYKKWGTTYYAEMAWSSNASVHFRRPGESITLNSSGWSKSSGMDGVFYAVYGTTTFQQVWSAINQGLQVYVMIMQTTPGTTNTYIVPFVSFNTETFEFFTFYNNSNYIKTSLNYNEGWSSVTYG